MKRFFIAALIFSAFNFAAFGEPEKKEKTCGCELLSGYLNIGEALAADDFPASKKAASELLKAAKQDNIDGIVAGAKAVVASSDIAAARKSFKKLTREIVPLAEGDDDYTVMTCPLAHADWVQAKGDTHNPYFGKAMLNCGSRKKTS